MEFTGGVRSWVEWSIKGEGDGMGRRTSVGGREGWEEGITHFLPLYGACCISGISIWSLPRDLVRCDPIPGFHPWRH